LQSKWEAFPVQFVHNSIHMLLYKNDNNYLYKLYYQDCCTIDKGKLVPRREGPVCKANGRPSPFNSCTIHYTFSSIRMTTIIFYKLHYQDCGTIDKGKLVPRREGPVCEANGRPSPFNSCTIQYHSNLYWTEAQWTRGSSSRGGRDPFAKQMGGLPHSIRAQSDTHH